jgi:predicted SnoaL-like aldol condensation-catalyzing enzyme
MTLKYKPKLVRNLMRGDLVDLHRHPMVTHKRNAETCTPDVIDRLKHEFAEVHKVDKGFECITVLFQFGEITFPDDAIVQVFDES